MASRRSTRGHKAVVAEEEVQEQLAQQQVAAGIGTEGRPQSNVAGTAQRDVILNQSVFVTTGVDHQQAERGAQVAARAAAGDDPTSPPAEGPSGQVDSGRPKVATKPRTQFTNASVDEMTKVLELQSQLLGTIEDLTKQNAIREEKAKVKDFITSAKRESVSAVAVSSASIKKDQIKNYAAPAKATLETVLFTRKLAMALLAIPELEAVIASSTTAQETCLPPIGVGD